MKFVRIAMTILIAPTLSGCVAMSAASRAASFGSRAARFGGSAAGKASRYGAAKSSIRSMRRVPLVVDDVERPSRRSLLDHVQPPLDVIGNIPTGNFDAGSYDPESEGRWRQTQPYVPTKPGHRSVDIMSHGYRPSGDTLPIRVMLPQR